MIKVKEATAKGFALIRVGGGTFDGLPGIRNKEGKSDR